MHNDNRLLYLVFAGTIFLVLLMVAVSKWSPNDGQTFTALSTMAGGFGGAFLNRLPTPTKPSDQPAIVAPPKVELKP